MSLLSVQNITVSKGRQILVDNVSLTISAGELVVLVGPNGAGKTTLLRAALGLTTPDNGTAILGDRDAQLMAPDARARIASYLPQTRPLAWPNKVRDIVALGRYGHGAAPHRLSAPDRTAVDRAINACALGGLADRSADTLSGGELARMHCARAFAAETPLLIADEPVAALDPLYQFQVMELVQNFVSDGGATLTVLHDLSLAARFATRLIWMKDGRIVADGPPSDTLTEDQLAAVFGVRARIDADGVPILQGAV